MKTLLTANAAFAIAVIAVSIAGYGAYVHGQEEETKRHQMSLEAQCGVKHDTTHSIVAQSTYNKVRWGGD